MRQVKGFSMIELLVAVLVMAIGILGITALQLASLQNNRGALHRAEAVHLAYDMLDRIRANPLGTPVGQPYGGLDMTDVPPNTNDCYAGNCSAVNMVAFDQAVWKCSLGAFHDENTCQALRAGLVIPLETDQPGLPLGDGTISVDGGTGLITITVQWTGANNAIQTVVVTSRA
ncbi:MAG: type IV pilus modification protein PilV [Gammaproteobacteria bacterium]|nr:type IV pilus modification protein PilV [Gammaproteobacteria bacterium]